MYCPLLLFLPGSLGRVRKTQQGLCVVGSRCALKTVQGWCMELVTILWLALQKTLLSCRRMDTLRMQVSTFQIWVCVYRELLGQKSLGDLVHPPGYLWSSAGAGMPLDSTLRKVVMWSEGQLTLPWTLADLWWSCGPGRAGCSHPALCGPSDSPWFCCYNALVV